MRNWEGGRVKRLKIEPREVGGAAAGGLRTEIVSDGMRAVLTL